MSQNISTSTPLPNWITSAYNKTNPTVESITRELSATKVTDIAQVNVGGFYLAKMPWYGRNYDEVIREMIEKAKKDPAIIDKITENKKNKDEYNTQYSKVENEYDEKYYRCLFENEYDEYLKLQKLVLGREGGYKAGVAQTLLFNKYHHNKGKCEHIKSNKEDVLDKMKDTAPHGFINVEDLYGSYKYLKNIPLLFIQVLDNKDAIRCYGYNVKTGMVYSTFVDRRFSRGNDVDVFFIDFEVGELYSIDEKVIQKQTVAARAIFDKGFVDPLKTTGKLGGKRRSKTNGRFRKYRSRRNISSRTQRRKKTQRRQRR